MIRCLEKSKVFKIKKDIEWEKINQEKTMTESINHKNMKSKKLVPMTQFILDIDWMTTKEFCDTYKIPYPTVIGGVNDFLQVDAIKQKNVCRICKVF